jgi:hypothetical protein
MADDKFYVAREHRGDKMYHEGDPRTVRAGAVSHLVERGVLVPWDDDKHAELSEAKIAARKDREKTGTAKAPESGSESEPAGTDYASMEVDALKALIAARDGLEEPEEGSGKNKRVVKDDLIATLEADDAARLEAESSGS